MVNVINPKVSVMAESHDESAMISLVSGLDPSGITFSDANTYLTELSTDIESKPVTLDMYQRLIAVHKFADLGQRQKQTEILQLYYLKGRTLFLLKHNLAKLIQFLPKAYKNKKMSWTTFATTVFGYKHASETSVALAAFEFMDVFCAIL